MFFIQCTYLQRATNVLNTVMVLKLKICKFQMEKKISKWTTIDLIVVTNIHDNIIELIKKEILAGEG